MDRRTFITATGTLAGAAAIAPDFWRTAFVQAATLGRGPYGPLGSPDGNGIRLPAGFTSRVIARCGQQVASTGYTWPLNPDGGQCYPLPTGGWIYVANSEVENDKGGASSIRFSPEGAITSAYSICSGTSRNCSGGITPWRTYLTAEESGSSGQVYECDPFRPGQGVLRAGLGSFNHEAAVVDPATGHVYLTEDHPQGRLYKFVPSVRGDLSRGQLYAASLSGTKVTWIPTASNTPDRQATTTAFDGGEGMYVGDGAMFFTTKGDKKIWELTLRTNKLVVLHDASTAPADNLNAVDAIVVHYNSGDLFVAEDGGNMEVGVLGLVGGERQVASFLRLEGHAGSEITGLAFTPDGTRMYFSSQRGPDGVNGVTYEITGPFRRAANRIRIDRDSYVRGGDKSTTNYGNDTELQVCTNASDQFTKIAFLSVDTGAYEPTAARAVVRISARLTKGTTSTLRVHAVPAGWNESTLTWANRPTLGKELDEVVVRSTSFATYTIDLSAHVAAERAAGRSRVAIALVQDGVGDVVLVRSSESTTAPPVMVLAPMLFPPLQAVTYTAVDDAHVRGGISSTTNYGSKSLMEVRQAADVAATRTTYIAFDTAPFVREVSTATLRISARSTGAVPAVVDVYATAANWTESSITWANKPSAGTKIGSFTVTTRTFRTYTVDVTAHAKSRRAAGADRVAIVLRGATNGDLIEVVATELGRVPPRLTLT